MKEIQLIFTPSFLRKLKKYDPPLQEEVIEKVNLFKNPDNHNQLKVHKLQGRLRNRYSFSVNYKIRIVFFYESKKKVVLTAIGSHDIYN